MQLSGSKPAPRGLVVDDDSSLCDYMAALLRPMGVTVDSALDGREAEQHLRRTAYDVLFLDLRLPILSGEMILQLMNKGMFQRPGAIVLMSAFSGGPTPEQMVSLGVAGFLAKPFAPADVRASVEYALASRTPASAAIADAASSSPILVTGSGLWSDAMMRVVQKSGGRPVHAPTVADALALANAERPGAVVGGPPLSDADLVSLCSGIRGLYGAGPGESGLPVLVGIGLDDAGLRTELEMVGATRVLTLPAGLPEMAGEIARATGLSRRAFRRAPLSSAVIVHAGENLVGGFATDLSEGGLGMSRLTERPVAHDGMSIEFALPGEEGLVLAGTELAWVREAQDGLRAGLRFKNLVERDRSRIRRYVESAGSASTPA